MKASQSRLRDQLINQEIKATKSHGFFWQGTCCCPQQIDVFFDVACAQRTRWGPQKKTMKTIHDSCMVASPRRQFKMDTFQKNQSRFSESTTWTWQILVLSTGLRMYVCACVTSNTFISQAFSGTTVGGLSDIISFYFLQFYHVIVHI